ncbi:MAG TPA: RNA polymerase sigma-54 factor, partial [Rhodospirillales bacterium]|nr:RNA polymerase sigma-54 factor [Rhodospirillales bacterium]
MAINLGLQVRQTQGLVLTPQLQQAIKLLQLSHLELQALVQRELVDNPFLRLADHLERPAGEAGERADTAAAPRSSGLPEEDPDGWPQPPTPVAADARLATRSCVSRAPAEPAPTLEQRLTRPPSLQEHLRLQLGADVGEPRLRAVALALVDHLDEDGYLRETDAELAQRLGVTEERVAEARAALQRCDPTGVGARDLRECLALQLAERDRLDPLMARLLDHLDLLARADFARLMR